MRAVVIMVLMLVGGCPGPVEPLADGPPVDALPDAPDSAVCPGEQLRGPFDPAAPLYGEACAGEGAGCRSDLSVPGDWAGVCIAGTCRPRCGYYEWPPGVNVGQCCLRGGQRQEGPGFCGCVP